MDYSAVESLRERHPAWRMLTAHHAPLLLSFLGRFFVEEGRGASPERQLIDALDDQLYQLNSEDPDTPRFPREASDYLADWAAPEAGYLRRFYHLTVRFPPMPLGSTHCGRGDRARRPASRPI